MKTLPPFALGLLAGISLLGSACTTRNTSICLSNDDCGPGLDCVQDICEARAEAPDAGAGTPAEPDAAVLAETDAAPFCDTETRACVEAVPTGWSGPAVRAISDSNLAAPACPSGFDDAIELGFSDLETSGSCSCDCPDTTNFSCLDGGVEGRDGPGSLFACFADCSGSSCVSQPLSDNQCTRVSVEVASKDLLRLNEGEVIGGSCPAGIVSDDFEAEFATQTKLCVAAELPQTCEEGGLCAPAVPIEFGGQTCIFQSGIQECPAFSEYTERELIFADFIDSRQCGSCSCDPVNTNCGTVETYDNASCDGTPQSFGLCAEDTALARHAKFIRRSSSPCSVSSQPQSQGLVIETNTTTVCCTAP